MDLITVADFLQMEAVIEFCFEFLESIMTIDNCIEIVKTSTMYHNASDLKTTYDFISENFDELAQTDAIKSLSKDALMMLIGKIDFSKFQHSSIYKAIINWTQHEESRKVDFIQLFFELDLQQLSLQFLKVIAKEPLVKSNSNCLNAIIKTTFAKLEPEDSRNLSKILCVNGRDQKSVFEVYGITGDINRIYPQVPNKPLAHRLLRMNDFVYCIGGFSQKSGITSKIYQLNFTEANMQWKKLASMKIGRCNFGAAVFRGGLVVNGSADCATEFYNPRIDEWKTIAPTMNPKIANTLVATDDALFAIGVSSDMDNASVERLDDLDGEWKEVQSMNTPRCSCAAVFCKGFVYVIGGHSTKVEKTVERYDPGDNVWTNVSSMNVERRGHAACVLQGKIYVVGGRNAAEVVVEFIECYDPELDRWEIVGETKENCFNHAVVAL